MNTDAVIIEGNGDYLNAALDRVEGLANVEKLSEKESLYLRLLAEELFGIVRATAGDIKAKFYAEGNGREFKLVLESDARLDEDIKNALLAISTTGTNEADVGVIAKLSNLFNISMKGLDASSGASRTDGISYGKMGLVEESAESFVWSLKKYKESAGQDGKAEFEKSVVGTVADDVKVGIKDKKVKIVIYKKF